MQTLMINGYPLAFTMQGSGPAILFLHGFCEDQSMWNNYCKPLENKGLQVITVDLPGFGQSPAIKPIPIAEMGQLLIQMIRQLQISPVILLGHSMGGYVALEVAAQQPEVLSGLGLVFSHPFADTEDVKNNRLKSIAFIQKNGHHPFVKQLIPKLFPQEYAERNPELIAQLIQKAEGFPREGIQQAQLAMANRKDHTSTLQKCTVPVLFLLGEADDLISTDKKLAQTHLPDTAVIHLLKGIGHMGTFEAPQQCAGIFSSFADYCLLAAKKT